MSRSRPALLLVVAVIGIVWFSRRLNLADTVALIICGFAAGGALAALAAARQRAR